MLRFRWLSIGALFFASACGTRAHAGGGGIAVYDGAGKPCQESEPEFPVLRLTSREAIQSLNDWLNIRPQTLSDKSTATFHPGPEIAFTGYIKFCGTEERRAYFSALIGHLKSEQKNDRAYVIFLLHSRSNLLLEMLDSELAAKPGDDLFRKNLEKAKRLVAFQRRTPEPYPTETIVRKIERKLSKSAAP